MLARYPLPINISASIASGSSSAMQLIAIIRWGRIIAPLNAKIESMAFELRIQFGKQLSTSAVYEVYYWVTKMISIEI